MTPVYVRFIFLMLIVQSAFAAVCTGQEDRAEEQRKIDFFEAKIRPVLIEACYECHALGEDREPKGGLALDSLAGWQLGGDSGPAIIPSDADASLLMEAIRYEGVEMPPDGRLADEVIANFEKWISEGAVDPRKEAPSQLRPADEFEQVRDQELWSLEPVQAQPSPDVKEAKWGNDPIDSFVLKRLQENGLSASGPSDRYRLARRIAFDLTGLPPSPARLKAFIEDTRPDAVERFVDGLLNSPQFGEQWGRHWLDVARYADSNGSDFNATFHNAWRYRNYVIETFNEDRPYDQFVREQVAGDLLEFANDSQRKRQLIGSGFLMLGAKMLSERDKEKLRMDVVDEQIDTVGRTFMGLTLGCARCHDHKFDPISTEDYYSLAGIFRSTAVLEGEIQKYVSNWHRAELPMEPVAERALAEFNEKRGQAVKDEQEASASLKTANDDWIRRQSELPGIVVDDVEAEAIGQWKESTISPRYFGKGYRHDDKAAKGEKQLIYRANLPADGLYEVRVSYTANTGRTPVAPYRIEHADGETTVRVNQIQRPSAGQLFQPIGRFRFLSARPAVVTLSNDDTTDFVIADAVQFIPVDTKTDLDLDAAAIAAVDADVERLIGVVLTARDAEKQAKKRVEELDKQGPAARPLAIAVTDTTQVEDCAIRIRGETHQLGEIQPRNVPVRLRFDDAIQIAPDSSGRLPLADWLSDPRHPLTARVMVNRIWSKLLGQGLVRSVDNFGNLGESPTHPELLDTLATDFVEHDWSVKYLVRRIVLSQTYQQAGNVDAASVAADPDNRWLGRFSRRRLPVESIRDSMLEFGGQLDRRMGESSVSEFGTLVVDNNKQEANVQSDDSRLRTIYTPIIRNELSPMLTVFDFADPNFVVGQRPNTNVPAQALLMLNSPFVRQCATQMAERRLAQPPQSLNEELKSLYLAALNRPASDSEQLAMREFVGQTLGVTIEEIDGEFLRLERDDKVRRISELIIALLATDEFRTLD